MFDFAEATKDMTAAEILNYYRNLYYAEPQVTERGIVANAINDYLQKAAPRAEWISVEERLPERELKELMRMNPLKVFPCLVVITSDYYNKAYVSQAYYAEEGFISGDSGLITERITHWMPLPEPPKESKR